MESINKLKQAKDETKIKIASQEDLIKSKYGSLDFEVINKMIEKGQEIIKKYDYFNECHLREVKEKLEKLKKKMALLQNEAMSNSRVYTEITSYVNNKSLDGSASAKELEITDEANIEESNTVKR